MENQEIKKSCSAPSQTALFGILVLTVGVVLLLKNLRLINSETSRIIFSWPMLLIAVGVINLIHKSKIWGIVLIAIGAFFLLTRYLGYPASIGQVFWPTLIIFAGVMLIISASGFWIAKQAFADRQSAPIIAATLYSAVFCHRVKNCLPQKVQQSLFA